MAIYKNGERIKYLFKNGKSISSMFKNGECIYKNLPDPTHDRWKITASNRRPRIYTELPNTEVTYSVLNLKTFASKTYTITTNANGYLAVNHSVIGQCLVTYNNEAVYIDIPDIKFEKDEDNVNWILIDNVNQLESIGYDVTVAVADAFGPDDLTVLKYDRVIRSQSWNYRLAADIDASITGTDTRPRIEGGWEDGFLPICNNRAFTATFDGAGHSITNLHVDNTYSGTLFGQLDGTVNGDVNKYLQLKNLHTQVVGLKDGINLISTIGSLNNTEIRSCVFEYKNITTYSEFTVLSLQSSYNQSSRWIDCKFVGSVKGGGNYYLSGTRSDYLALLNCVIDMDLEANTICFHQGNQNYSRNTEMYNLIYTGKYEARSEMKLLGRLDDDIDTGLFDIGPNDKIDAYFHNVQAIVAGVPQNVQDVLYEAVAPTFNNGYLHVNYPTSEQMLDPNYYTGFGFDSTGVMNDVGVSWTAPYNTSYYPWVMTTEYDGTYVNGQTERLIE